jgi:hypothetical protein
MLRLPIAGAPPGRDLLHVEVRSDASRRPDVVSRA